MVPEAVANSQLNVRAGPSGIHIFDRTTGLNLLVDEVRIVMVQAVQDRKRNKLPRTTLLLAFCDLLRHLLTYALMGTGGAKGRDVFFHHPIQL